MRVRLHIALMKYLPTMLRHLHLHTFVLHTIALNKPIRLQATTISKITKYFERLHQYGTVVIFAFLKNLQRVFKTQKVLLSIFIISPVFLFTIAELKMLT